MLRGNMMRMAWVVSAIAMVSGCTDCGPKPVADCTDTTATFTGITSGATVSSPLDAFSVDIKSADGSAFPIDAATVSIGGMTFTGMPDGSRATFTGVTAAAGAQTLSVTIGAGSCSKTYASLPITVQSSCAGPGVTAVEALQDTLAPVGILTRAELPSGVKPQVRISARCATGLSVRVLRGTDEVGPATAMVNGSAVVDLTLPTSDLATYDLRAELLDNGTAVGDPNDPAAKFTLSLDLRQPACSLVNVGPFGPTDDLDLSAAGLQVRVTGTMDLQSAGTLTIAGQTPVPVTPNATGDFAADFTFTTSGSYVAALTCVQSVTNNQGTDTKSVVIDLDPPTISITSPVSADGGSVTVTNSPLVVEVATTGAPDGSTVTLTVDGMTPGGGQGTVTNNVATIPVSFGADGSHLISVTVDDGKGNVSAPAEVQVEVVLAGCGALFLRPGACPALLTTSQLSAGSYAFQTTSKASCNGQPVTLFRSDLLADGGVVPEVQVSTTAVSGAGTATFAATPVTSGDFNFRASVTNVGADAGTSDVSCRVTVDLDGPAITSPIKPTSAPYATLNINQDGLPGVPGIQRPASLGGLTFSARVPMGGRVDVCTSQSTNPVTGMTRPTSPECGSGWYVLQQGVVSPVDGFTFPDGQYQIKIVVVGGGLAMAPASAPLPIFADSQRPCITARRLPQDTTADGRLNITELNGAAPQLEFALSCGDTGPADLAATGAVVIRDVTLGAPGATRAATPVFANGKYTVALTVPASTEVDLNLFVEVTDLAGNKNLYQMTNDPSSFLVRVDPVAPSCVIQSPGASQTLVGIAGAPGGSFSMQVATSADVGTNGVRVTFGSLGSRDLTPTNSVAQSSFNVTGTASYAVTATCTDAAGNATTATPRNTTIDLDAPTCTITAPTSGSYASNRIPTSVAVTGADGQSVTIRSTLQVAPISSSLVVGGGTAAATLSYPKGVQTITADVQDAAGNPCTQASVANVNVTSDACLLDLRNVVVNSTGSWKNRSAASNLTNLTATTADMAGVIANSTDCRSGERVTLQRTAPTAGPVIELVTAANGDVVLSPAQSISDGDIWTVTAYSPTNSTTPLDIKVGLKVPAGVVTLNGNAVAAGQPLYFVATSDNMNLNPNEGPPKTDRYFADQVPGTAGAQINVALTGVTGVVNAGSPGKIEVLYGATTPISQQVTMDNYSLASTGITLDHNSTGAFTVRLTSAAGNVTDLVATTAAVDVIAPGQPTVNTPVLASARAALLNVGWSVVYDDGTDTSSGALTGGSPLTRGYDIRWTTGAVYGNAGLATDAAFFSRSNISTLKSATDPNPASLDVPPLNTYFAVVRARDEVGNYSAYLPASDPLAVTKVQTLVNMWSGALPVSVTGVGADFGSTVAAESSVIGDSKADLVVSSPVMGAGSAGAVFVFAGKSNFGGYSGACVAPDCQQLIAPDALGSLFGGDLSTDGNVADNATEAGVADILIGQRGYSTTGRVFIYLGTRGGSISQYIEIRGDAANTGIGQSARIVPDIDGDGYDEVVISAFAFGSNRGRVYVFRGRALASWQSLFPMSQQYVPVTSADWVVEAEALLTASSNGLALGRLGVTTTPGFTGRTRLDGGVAPELVLPMARTTIGRVPLFGYDQLRASSVSAPVAALDGGIQTLFGTTNTSVNSAYWGFGAGVAAGAGETAKDLYVGNPIANEVVRYSNWSPSGVVGGTRSGTVSGPAYLGAQVILTNVDSSPGADLVIAEGQILNNGVWVLYQRQGVFDAALGGTNVRFWLSEFRNYRAGQSTLGPASVIVQNRIVSIGDLDGVNGLDLVIADGSSGVVHVWK